MKTVYLVRHGKADHPAGPVNDFDRVLVERGYRDAENVASTLAEKGFIPDVIVSSPAARAIATARVFAERLDYKQEIRENRSIYDNGYSEILSILSELDDSLDSAMIVGHNPDISTCAHLISTDFDQEVKTSSVIGIAFDIDTWPDIAGLGGHVILFENPGTVKKKKNMKKDVAERLTSSINAVLSAYDADAAAGISDLVQDVSRDIARKFVKTVSSAGTRNR